MRTFGYLIEGLLFWEYLLAAFDGERRALHDRLAGTVVVDDERVAG
jgi:uncharacterized RDD family membrane protein YckC